MRSRLIIPLTVVALAVPTLGCGVLSQVKGIADNVSAISDLSGKLGKAEKMTYTAEYAAEGKTISLVHEPTRAAYLGPDGRFIATPDAYYLCTTAENTCQKTPTQGAGVPESAMMGGITGEAFVSPELAVGTLTVAAILPHATVVQSKKTIAGKASTCAKVTAPEPTTAPDGSSVLVDFTVCVTDEGILASFTGTTSDGKKGGIELTKFAGSVDASAFAPPAGATIVDVTVPAPLPS